MRKSPQRAQTPKTSPKDGAKAGLADLCFRAVTAETWTDFEALFEGRGGPKTCWCMLWRRVDKAKGDSEPASPAAMKKAAMKKRIDQAIPVGILGYVGAQPVAWCSVAPRQTYRGGLADPQEGDQTEMVWSVVCFFVSRAVRGRGVWRRLLQAAEAYAKTQGATRLEAYPVDEDSPSYRFGGFLPSFKKAGFSVVGRAGTRRYVVRKPL